MDITLAQSSTATLRFHLHRVQPNSVPDICCNGYRPCNFKASTKPAPYQTQYRKRKHELYKPKIKPFKEEDAFPSSIPLHRKNPSAIYRYIQKFARENKLKEALTIMDYMDNKGIPVNHTTFSALIAACVRTKCLDHGQVIHTHIRINGLERNEFLRTKLVHMYTSCGAFEEAKKVFDEDLSESVYPWNAFLRGSVISGGRQHREALSTYMEMRALGIELNVYSYSNVIKSFAGSSAFHQGLKIHALLIKNGLTDSSILRTSLIDMYLKCGKIKLARHLFEEIGERDIVMWGAMIAGFVHNRLEWKALEYARRMIEQETRPNKVILTSILPAIAEMSARKLGKELHAYIVKTKTYSKQIPIQSALIDMYCKCGDISSGRRVFYSSEERNVICWTALMSGYASNGRLEHALRSVIWMQQEGLRPDVVTVATAIPICAELRALKPGKEIHAYSLKNWFLPNVSVVSALMKMYSKCGILEYSNKLFEGMEQRNVILWTTMIDSFIENEHLYDALDVIRSMQLSRHRPDSVAMSRVLCVCGKLKLLKLGKETHGQLLKKDLVSVHFVSAELVKMYGYCGLVDKANLAFKMVSVQGSMTRTAILEAYEHNELYREAIHLFHQMKSKGFSPNHFTFKVILSVCNKAGFVDDARRIFDLMYRKYSIKPTEEHYSPVIQLLTRHGFEDEAKRYARMSSSL